MLEGEGAGERKQVCKRADAHYGHARTHTHTRVHDLEKGEQENEEKKKKKAIKRKTKQQDCCSKLVCIWFGDETALAASLVGVYRKKEKEEGKGKERGPATWLSIKKKKRRYAYSREQRRSNRWY
jgi:hypothetical protein